MHDCCCYQLEHLYNPEVNVGSCHGNVAGNLSDSNLAYTGACPGFLKGGGPISLGSLKKEKRSSDFKRGVQWSEGGGPVHLSH